jgi:SAM-dependent methyltransferase
LAVIQNKQIIKWNLSKIIRNIYIPSRSEAVKLFFRIFGRPVKKLETFKAKNRRIVEGFFEKYCKGNGLDIGYGGDLLSENCKGFDYENGDAQYMNGVQDNSYDFVYSSHTLEHMINPAEALKNWFRIVKKHGFLILYVPHRDLYEKKTSLPSKWNQNHRYYFLLSESPNEYTLGLIALIENNLINFEIVYAKVCDYNHTITDPEIHSDGEYSIEIVVKKF